MGTSNIEQGMDDMQGIIPRCVLDLFENLKTGVERENLIKSKVTVSSLEVYGEKVYDLNCLGKRSSLRVREDINGGRGVFVEGLRNIEVDSAKGALDLLNNGTKTRYTAATDMNATSSRSHAIYTINLQQKLKSSLGNETHELNSKLTFVDLAGSVLTLIQVFFTWVK
jgi:kinesin family protein 1